MPGPGAAYAGLTQRVAGDILELWAPCAIQDAARVLARLRQAAVGLPVLGVESGTPSAADLECRDRLRSVAAGLVPDCLVAT